MTAAARLLRWVRLVLRQALRLRLRGISPSVALMVAIPAAFVMGSFLVTAATSLSPQQQKTMNFGRFDACAGYGVVQVNPGEDAIALDIGASVAAGGVDESMMSLSAVNFYVIGMTSPKSRFEEHPWTDHPFPERYDLLAGRWPSTPGEVAVSGDPSITPGARISAGGTSRLTVTGTVDDRYADKAAILAAPGTWADLDPGLADRYETMRAQPLVYWTGGDDTAVLDAIYAAVKDHPGAGDREVLDSSYAVAPSGEESRATPWIDKLPIAYSIPASLFPALTVALAFSLSGPRVSALRLVARGLGMRDNVLVVAHYLPVAGVLVVAAAVGGGIGIALPYLAGGLLEQAAGRPVDLDVGAGGQLFRYILAVALSALSLVAAAVALPAWRAGRARRQPSRPDAPPSASTTAARRWWRLSLSELRRLASLAMVCTAMAATPSVDSPGTATAAATAVMLAGLLVLPDMLRAVLVRIPTRSWSTRLATARIQARFGAALATTMTLALVIGVTFGYLVVLQTWLTSANGDRAPKVAPKEVLVVNRSSHLFQPAPATVTAVQDALGEPIHRIPLRWSTELDHDGMDVARATVGDSLKPLLVVDPADLSAILGHPLSPVERQTIQQSGALLWHGGDFEGAVNETDNRPLHVVGRDGEPVRLPQSVTTMLTTAPASQWRYTAAGVVSTDTAERLGLPITQGAVLFSDVTQAPDPVADTVLVAGIDPDTVQIFSPAENIVPAVALPGLAIALGALMFLVSVATTWSGARTNSKFLRMLVTLGLPPTTARRVVWTQYAVVLIVAFGVGLVLATIPVVTVLLLLPGYELSVPTSNVLTLGISTLLGCFAAIGVATGRIHASARALGHGA